MVKTITRDELVKMISSNEKLKLVDVLSRESFAVEHIKNSISLPLFECQASTKAAEKLLSLGYKDVLDYKGGLKDYKEANLPLEGNVLHSACSAC